MKKILVAMSTTLAVALAVGGAVISSKVSTADTLLNANVEAVAGSEGVKGHCDDSTGECMATCPNCGAAYYAKDFKGPSSSMSGKCDECKASF